LLLRICKKNEGVVSIKEKQSKEEKENKKSQYMYVIKQSKRKQLNLNNAQIL